MKKVRGWGWEASKNQPDKRFTNEIKKKRRRGEIGYARQETQEAKAGV